jgi:hypothetical protein
LTSGFPLFGPFCQFGFGKSHGQFLFFGVDGDHIAVFNERDGAAHGGFGADVAHHPTVTSSGKRPSVNNPTLSPNPFPERIAVKDKHFPHARPPLGPFVADHHHISGFDGPFQRGLGGGFFPVNTLAGRRFLC